MQQQTEQKKKKYRERKRTIYRLKKKKIDIWLAIPHKMIMKEYLESLNTVCVKTLSHISVLIEYRLRLRKVREGKKML